MFGLSTSTIMKTFYSLGIKLESSLLIVNFASTAAGANFNKTTFNIADQSSGHFAEDGFASSRHCVVPDAPWLHLEDGQQVHPCH